MVLFDDFALQIGEGVHEFPSGGEDYEAYIINATKVALKTDARPSISDYTEVSGGTYVKQDFVNQDYTLADFIASFVADVLTWDQDAGAGPEDCYQVVLVLDGDQCFAFIDLTEDGGVTPLNLKVAPIILSFGAGTRVVLRSKIPANA
jgi:hypothetical protein